MFYSRFAGIYMKCMDCVAVPFVLSCLEEATATSKHVQHQCVVFCFRVLMRLPGCIHLRNDGALNSTKFAFWVLMTFDRSILVFLTQLDKCTKGKVPTLIKRHKPLTVAVQLQRCFASQSHRQSERADCRLSPHTWACSQIATRSSGLLFNGLHPRNPCNNMDYYSFTDPKGVEGWVGLFGWPIADTLPTKWSHVNHRSGVDQGKSASQRPTS